MNEPPLCCRFLSPPKQHPHQHQLSTFGSLDEYDYDAGGAQGLGSSCVGAGVSAYDAAGVRRLRPRSAPAAAEDLLQTDGDSPTLRAL